MSRKKVIVTVASIVVGLPTVLVLGCGAYLFWVFGGFTHAFATNDAKVAVEPLNRALLDAGATKLCDDGDPGYGPDNTQPWYNVWYRVPGDGEPATRESVLAAAKSGGLPLTARHKGTGPMAGATYTNFVPSDLGPDVDISSLEVDVHRRSTVYTQCGWEGESTSNPDGGAIYEIRATRPEHTL